MKKKFIKKLVLGTAQFGKTPYGIANKKKIEKKNIHKILNYAWNNGIYTYDTAESYNCYNDLADFIKKNKIQNKIKIITKVPSLGKINFEKKIINTIEKTLTKLKINSIYCLLFHNENDLSLIIKNKKKNF